MVLVRACFNTSTQCMYLPTVTVSVDTSYGRDGLRILGTSQVWRMIPEIHQPLKSKGFPRQAEVAQGVPGMLRPRIFLTVRRYKGGSSSAKRTGRLYPRRNPWYSLSEAESTSGHMVLSGVSRKKSPSDTTGNRSRDRPTSSAAP